MKLANLNDRLVVINGDKAVDVAHVSSGLFESDPQRVYARWEEFVAWSKTVDFEGGSEFTFNDLGPAVPSPRQFFAIGLNYMDHAKETNTPPPPAPMVFTKFQSSLSAPNCEIPIVSDTVDYEAELCVVIGKGGRNIKSQDALLHVAGCTIGQDISDRGRQLAGPAPQFSLAKSYQGFTPIGPWVVSMDELTNVENLAITTEIRRHSAKSREIVQNGTSADMIFNVSELIEYLSRFVELLPGDVIMTGTPAGVAMGGGTYLAVGDVLFTTIEGIGTMQNTCVEPGASWREE